MVDFELRPEDSYAVGTASLRPTGGPRQAVAEIDPLAADLVVLGWRELPVDPDQADIGPTARAVMPATAACSSPARSASSRDAAPAGLDLERTFCLSQPTSAPSAPTSRPEPRTIVYKGMLAEPQVVPFYPDLADER